MTDLLVGVLILTLATVTIFSVVTRLTARWHPRVNDAIAAGVLVLLGYYIRYVWDNVELARWLPVSNLIIVGNWLPLGIAALGGLAWNRVPPPITRKLFAVGLLFAVAAYAVYSPFRGKAPECHDTWEDGVCRQTTQDTCSAAAAATMLRDHKINATEQEMVDLCITRTGTTWLGLYRGLKLKTAGTDWDVEIISGDIDELLKDPQESKIVFLRLTADVADKNPQYEAKGWIAGTSHSAVLLRVSGNQNCLMGDPAVGLERLPVGDLVQLYEGRGMRLVRRPWP